MKIEYVHKDSRTLEEKPQVFTRWIDPTIEELKQENQELKLELSGYRQAILEDKDMLGLKEENQELKKQLEELQEENSRYERKNQKYKEVIDKAINLNEQIKHFVYENFLEENIIGSKIIYEFVEKQNKILKEVE